MFNIMSEYLGIKVVQKEGTENTFEVTISEKSPINTISKYKRIRTEDLILQIISAADEKHP
jgi:hypothetical protein